MAQHPKVAFFGTVHEASLRPEDLIPAFADTLDWLRNGTNRKHAKLVREANNLPDFCCEEAGDVLDELVEALQDYAPDYGYFGSHPGDGADYGFWLIEDWRQQMRDDGVVEINDTQELEDFKNQNEVFAVLAINDHGNATYFTRKSRNVWRTVWSVV